MVSNVSISTISVMTTAQRLALVNIPPATQVFDIELKELFLSKDGGATPIWVSENSRRIVEIIGTPSLTQNNVNAINITGPAVGSHVVNIPPSSEVAVGDPIWFLQTQPTATHTLVINAVAGTKLNNIVDDQYTLKEHGEMVGLVNLGGNSYYYWTSHLNLDDVQLASIGTTNISGETQTDKDYLTQAGGPTTIQIDDAETLDVGARLGLIRNDAASASISGDTAVSINGIVGGNFQITNQYGRAVAVKVTQPHGWIVNEYDSGSTSLADGAVLFGGAGGEVGTDVDDFNYDSTNKALSVGTDSHSISIDGAASFIKYNSSVDTTNNVTALQSYSPTASVSNFIEFARARGTEAAPTIISSLDLIGAVRASGYTGTKYNEGASIKFFAIGTPTATATPIGITLESKNVDNSDLSYIQLGPDGTVAIGGHNGSNGIFYDTDAGTNINGTFTINFGDPFNALAPTTTKGDLIVRNGSTNIRLPAGADTFVLSSDSAEASGVKWVASGGGLAHDYARIKNVSNALISIPHFTNPLTTLYTADVWNPILNLTPSGNAISIINGSNQIVVGATGTYIIRLSGVFSYNSGSTRGHGFTYGINQTAGTKTYASFPMATMQNTTLVDQPYDVSFSIDEELTIGDVITLYITLTGGVPFNVSFGPMDFSIRRVA